MPSNHLILCHALLLLPSLFPSIRGFSNESNGSRETVVAGGACSGGGAVAGKPQSGTGGGAVHETQGPRQTLRASLPSHPQRSCNTGLLREGFGAKSTPEPLILVQF